MSNLLAKRYKNNKAKAEANVLQGKKLSAQQKVENQKETITKTVVENVKVAKEVKTLMLD
ncbi:MAG: hypothetical protein IKY10_00395 [Clostridia bacterium]|nr:hypothetical protein [Clostridia bacterium]